MQTNPAVEQNTNIK